VLLNEQTMNVIVPVVFCDVRQHCAPRVTFAVEGGWCSVRDMEYVRVTSEPAGLYHRRDEVQGSQANCSLLSFRLHLARRAGKYKNRERRILIPELNKRSLRCVIPVVWYNKKYSVYIIYLV